MSFSALRERAQAVADALAGGGLQHGDRCLIWADNGADTAAAILGTIAARAIPVLVNADAPPAHFDHAASRTACARAIIADRLMSKIAWDGPIWRLEDIARLPASQIRGSRSGAPKLNDPASILFTSGSCGMPKGVTQSHANLIWGCQAVGRALGYGGDDSILCAIPWSFDYGWGQLLTTFLLGLTQVLPAKRGATSLCEALERHRPTILPGVPSLFADLIRGLSPIRETERGSVRLVTNTGSKIPPSLLPDIENLFAQAALSLNYGLTETYRSSTLPAQDAARCPDSVGYALPGADIRITAEDGTEAAPGELGEIIHRGAGVFLGYWGDPDRTRETRRPDPFWNAPGLDAPAVVFTGDLGWKDDQGRLFIKGRRDRQIKSMGVRVSPDEIEKLIDATGLVTEVAIIARKHETVGEQVVAVIAVRDRTDPPIRDLRRQARQTMSPYMQPMEYCVVDALPRTPSGKPDYPALMARFAGETVR